MPAETAYHDEVGDYFAKNADTSPYNAYTDRPAMLSLAGAVGGLKILDVGCGAGHYAAELLAGGAEVVGIDGSATLLKHARERLGDRAALRMHDAEQPLDFIDDASFDGVVCALMLHHIADRPRLLGDLRRVLRPGGGCWPRRPTRRLTGGNSVARTTPKTGLTAHSPGGRWQSTTSACRWKRS
ncbi:class I SAM-dependent methyltransferase (plasmid) [Streptomyces sp. NBC_00846]|uniref:class I SAM-dependent methyltransferase n=1 Tax=Streptomyces sp. NBC_00846 TaxID=2975849 RepID=UPI002F90ADB2|nr:class I SAM-dependent methyltransferase [Streptomyces sp. NBC_00846]